MFGMGLPTDVTSHVSIQLRSFVAQSSGARIKPVPGVIRPEGAAVVDVEERSDEGHSRVMKSHSEGESSSERSLSCLVLIWLALWPTFIAPDGRRNNRARFATNAQDRRAPTRVWIIMM